MAITMGFFSLAHTRIRPQNQIFNSWMVFHDLFKDLNDGTSHIFSTFATYPSMADSKICYFVNDEHGVTFNVSFL